ncbi:MAG: 4-hydroxy-3-methylbut-2-enyl diphosphate reductase [Desulfatiglans sp.]|nr:4-hydroxy-3-methylbut-2-enyl diphosphate reductase [Desulfatiglans sp.]
MKVKLARSAGFCMGVRRAMEMVLAEANRHEEVPLYTYGPLIHNTQVIDLLKAKKVQEVNDIKGLKSGTVLIRAHGIPPEERTILKESGLKIIDATCPRVAKVQAIIRRHAKKGYTTVIAGDRDHAEVIGLVGYAEGKAIVINSPEELSQVPDSEKICLVAQTTQNEELYEEIVKKVQERFSDAAIFNTICEATSERQSEVKEIASQVDCMVVVGGYHSGNTKRLAQVSIEAGTPAYHIETEKEIKKEDFHDMEVVGVTAGASTPNWMIKNVVKEIEGIKGRNETIIERWLNKAFKFLLLSNIMVALGAFALSCAAAVLSGRRLHITYPFIAFFYIYAIHVIYRFLDKGASTYNDPERAGFYKRHRVFLGLSSMLSLFCALSLSWNLGIRVFLVMSGMILLGIFYSIPIIPSGIRHLSRYVKIKDIPGSKTLLEAIAWAVVITLVPLLTAGDIHWPAVSVTFFVILSIAFFRIAFFDLFQVQGDLIVGVETLPISIGEKRTISILKWILVFNGALLVIAPIFKIVSTFSLLLLACFVTLALCMTAYVKRRIYPGTFLEALVEGNLFLAGLLSIIWLILT